MVNGYIYEHHPEFFLFHTFNQMEVLKNDNRSSVFTRWNNA